MAFVWQMRPLAPTSWHKVTQVNLLDKVKRACCVRAAAITSVQDFAAAVRICLSALNCGVMRHAECSVEWAPCTAQQIGAVQHSELLLSIASRFHMSIVAGSCCPAKLSRLQLQSSCTTVSNISHHAISWTRVTSNPLTGLLAVTVAADFFQCSEKSVRENNYHTREFGAVYYQS